MIHGKWWLYQTGIDCSHTLRDFLALIYLALLLFNEKITWEKEEMNGMLLNTEKYFFFLEYFLYLIRVGRRNVGDRLRGRVCINSIQSLTKIVGWASAKLVLEMKFDKLLYSLRK